MLGLGHLNDSYNFSFHVVIGSRAEEGQYSLNFHNCHNSIPGQEQPFDLTVSVEGQSCHSRLSSFVVVLSLLGWGGTMLRSHLSPPTMWVPGSKLRSAGLAAGFFMH